MRYIAKFLNLNKLSFRSIMSLFHCNAYMPFRVETSASSSASSRLPVIVIQKLNRIHALRYFGQRKMIYKTN